MRKIQKNLIFIIVFAIVCVSFIIGGVAVLTFNRVTVADNDQILSGITSENVDRMNEHYVQVENLVNTMAAHFIKELSSVDTLTNTETLQDYTGEMQKLAYSITENNDNVVASYLHYDPDLVGSDEGFYLNKNVYTNKIEHLPLTDLSSYDPTDFEHVGWYYLPIQKGVAVWIPPYKSTENHMNMVSYVKPLYAGGQLIGVVGLDVDFEGICKEVSYIHAYETGSAILIDEDGKVLYTGKQAPTIPQETIAQIIRTKGGILQSAFVDRQRIYNISSMKMRNDQYLVLVVPSEELNLERNRMIFTIILVTIAVSTVVILVITGMLKRMFQMSHTDALTGADNRTAYLEKVDDIERWIHTGNRARFSVIVFDINGLKAINDHCGHTAGDKLIIEGYQEIRKAFGRYNIYRIGGDEFAVIVEKGVNSYLEMKVDEFRQTMRERSSRACGQADAVVISGGLAHYEAGTDTGYEDTFHKADMQMYEDKQSYYKNKKQAISEDSRSR